MHKEESLLHDMMKKIVTHYLADKWNNNYHITHFSLFVYGFILKQNLNTEKYDKNS
jgi:hypothetical protein